MLANSEYSANTNAPHLSEQVGVIQQNFEILTQLTYSTRCKCNFYIKKSLVIYIKFRVIGPFESRGENEKNAYTDLYCWL